MTRAKDDGGDAYEGDSGGSLVVTGADYDIQVGVVSWGIGCASKDFPGVYTRVTAKYDWIRIRGDVCNSSSGPPA